MDRLPQVSWIVAPYIMCEHPSAPPGYGEALTMWLLDALAANRKVWAKTAFILNYDETTASSTTCRRRCRRSPPTSRLDRRHDGRELSRRAVRPRAARAGHRGLALDDGRLRQFAGLRPHLGAALLEARFAVAAPNISPWRRTVAGDLTSVFDFAQTGAVRVPHEGDSMKRADRQCKLDPPHWLSEDLPVQEKGGRPARALPYDLDVEGRAVGERLRPSPEQSRSRRGPRSAPPAEGAGPWFFTVEAGESLSYKLPRNGAYDFSVLGPNGFFRRFAGGDGDAVDAAFADGTLTVGNRSAADIVLRNAYDTGWSQTVAPGQSASVAPDLAGTANWYALSVDGAGYARIFAGHIENGAPSTSDPLLG